MACISRIAVALGVVLLVARPDVADSRLLAAARKPQSLVGDFDLPVFQLLDHSRSGAWALKGTPTHYEASGCKNVKKVYSKVVNKFATQMSISRCFAFCSKRKGLTYFGLSNGGDCWCGSAIDTTPMESSSCDKPCSGKPSDMCGGIAGTSVYVMIDCTNATKAELNQEAAEKRKALLTSYGGFEGESCGQDKNNVLQLDGKGFISGSVDTCKIACWEAKGAEECHGFSYDGVLSKCTFHYDVTAGKVKKDPKAACYFKIL